MDGKIRAYYAKNNLFASKMILPDMGEKFRAAGCAECKYYVNVVGQHETRKVCLSSVKSYYTGTKRVPRSIDIMELILLLGKEKLESMMGSGGDHKVACGEFNKKN
jgi:hypothetical protein